MVVEKSEQVKWLENVLGRPLLPCLSDSVIGQENRKTYLLDEHGNIIGLNLHLCSITDGSFLKELKALQSLDISYNNITDGSFLKKLKTLQSLDIS
ncbi:MAG: hypothetical protein ETSY1_44585 [Candidatus Entotheonella factor]|uniref:Uncharacterized protein n=1 Tax=Entotheonella factor TaxID=1429438 RepID=W4L2F9_ENTF1|nr:MAG: hypothetical protein ETSY1_44585 [Candidatus Entotheonella factor]